MKLLLTLIFSVITSQAYCCWCEEIKPFKNKDDLKGYQTIALVRIDDLGPLDNSDRHHRTTPNVKVTVLEQFKGERTTFFMDPGFNTSCNIGLQVGEEWLFFGIVYEGKMSVFSCDHTTKYKDADGYRDWFNAYSMGKLALLREIYQHSSPSLLSKMSYPNGKTEVAQHFINGLLDGKRNIWYPTGVPFITEDFDKGTRTGRRLIYSPSGQLIRDVTYKNNLMVKSISYRDTAETTEHIKMEIILSGYMPRSLDSKDSKDSVYYQRQLDSVRAVKGRDKQIQQVCEYSADGRGYVRKFYKSEGYMNFEERLDIQQDLYELITYYKNGKKKTHQLSYNKLNQQIDRTSATDGTSKETTSTCKQCKVLFNKDAPPAATPEPIYIQ